MDVRPLTDLYRVSERFRRSVNVAADLRDAGALAGYVPTAMVRTLLRRVVSELAREDGHRAWSITGPYGAGKSAFALFVSRVVGYPVDAGARRLLERADKRLYDWMLQRAPMLQVGGFLVVPVVGSRQPLVRSLAAGLRSAAEGLPAGSARLARVREHLVDLDERGRRGEAIASDEVAEAVVGLAEAAVAEAPGVAGVLMVYDELGRALEYAAMRPEAADVGLLQTLAEAAARSNGAPVVLVTILHQAFQNYAARLGMAQQREWAKVQGRFVDVPFLQSTGEVLTLVGHAIQRGEGDGGLAEAAEAAARRATALGLLPPGFDKGEVREALARCAPLHPTVALVLERLVRGSLAQNERSLFAFLGSREPHGLQEHLEGARWGANGHLPFYRLDRLYDYVRDALGSRLYGGAQARRWAQVEEALDRLPADAGALEARVLKTVGMLELLGDGRRVKASAEVVAFALGDGDVGEGEAREALERLAAGRVLVFRRFKGAYGLWEGSDVDLEGRLAEGLARVAPTARLAEVVERAWRPTPRVAKRHLHETGTFRFFRTWVVDSEALAEVRERPLKGADGAIVMVAPAAGEGLDALREGVGRLMDRLPERRRQCLLFAIPRDVQGVREAALEVLACQWVTQNTPQLAGDGVARRELAERELAARERLTRMMERCFGLESDAEAVWLYDGREVAIRSSHDLSAAVSAACKRMYASAPVVRNELVNRRSLSSAAAAGRRNLIEAMLKHEREERLGLEGFPPEMSMYLSVLEASGLHRKREGVWSFGPPPADDPCQVKLLWDTIDAFLADTQDRPLPVEELYKRLARPPLGVLPGLMPIYLTAALLHWWGEMAVYELGTFVPEAGIAHLERLLRVPERFTLQRYTPSPGRQEVLWGYARVFQQDADPSHVTLLQCTRMLLGLAASLPPYTLRSDALSAEARAVRDALMSAREPQTLLFQALPVSLGFLGIDASEERREAYLQALRRSLIELRDAYVSLLERIRGSLYEVLRLSADHPGARQVVARAAEACIPLSGDLRLEAFLRRLAEEQHGEREWLESVAALVVNKPPHDWLDRDIATFENGLAELSAQFHRLQDIALSRGVCVGGGRVMRLGLTDSEGQELSQIVHVSSEEEAGVVEIVRALNAVLDGSALRGQARLLAVAELARQLLDSTDQRGTDA